MSSPTVVIMAGGQGTRMRSRVPKVLHPICGRAMALWPVHAALEAGAGRVVVVGGPDRALEPVLPEGVVLAVQERPLGTGDAVRSAAPHIGADDTVVVLSGDVPLVTAAAIRALADAHEASGARATMATMVLDDPAGYGRVVRAADGSVERVVETKAQGDATEAELAIREVNTGVYAFHGGPLLEQLAALGNDNAQGEYYLPDVLPGLRPVGAYVLDDPTLMLGVNDRVDLQEVRALAQQRIIDAHARAGVTFVSPATTVVDAGVRIGADTVVEQGCTLSGDTVIGEGCAIGPHTTIRDSAIGDDVTVRHSWLDGAEVEAGATVGPFAYLRPGAHLRERAKAGTFVEIKNSDIGEGTKVPHLSYIGDADIGPGTNIGASNVTANYDGVNKHRTTIGAGVKTSVDTTFVAPVTVGDGAYTAAGSVIVADVPPGALGVARSRQTNVEGYAERRRRSDRRPSE
ncbi:MAG TPA: bifunctional UDP-N-acetylglucosamine diphosphorylase/glucosamine-1-phosphate N-acetyltransferase GlmU [Capillimicrobium sp.]|nr:bifunctional UDP-N-acetylglucosamine diphosphorylase/glucosamine-1-phosphate N-acetyltransferase GlmU [Capillimicrobium sp.]